MDRRDATGIGREENGVWCVSCLGVPTKLVGACLFLSCFRLNFVRSKLISAELFVACFFVSIFRFFFMVQTLNRFLTSSLLHRFFCVVDLLGFVFLIFLHAMFRFLPWTVSCQVSSRCHMLFMILFVCPRGLRCLARAKLHAHDICAHMRVRICEWESGERWGRNASERKCTSEVSSQYR